MAASVCWGGGRWPGVYAVVVVDGLVCMMWRSMAWSVSLCGGG